MTDRLTVEAGTVERAQQALRRLSRDLADTDAETAAAARTVAAAARARAPRRSGRLASSIRPAGPGEVVASARHAGPIERGVGPRPGLPGPHNIRPRRYMAAAAEQAATAVLNTFTAAAAAKLRKVK